jgi:hypothetical protein
VKKKTLLTATLSGLIFLTAVQLCFVKFTNANPLPYSNYIRVSPPAKPSITILSPAENNTLHTSNKLTISFSATIKPVSVDAWITKVHYNTSWQPNNITVYQWSYHDLWTVEDDDPYLSEYSRNLSLTGIPEGNQTVSITVYGSGSYSKNLVLYYFDAVSYCTVGFTVDTVPPKVSVLELDNKTFIEPEVPLNFTANESVSKIAYALDGQDNVTIVGNTTLTGLPTGVHNVTVYAWDTAGNTGASGTIYFSIAEPEPQPEPFPTTLVIAPIASVAVVGVGLIVYFKKRKHQNGK